MQFEIGKTYYARSIGDHECIFKIKITGRTEKMLIYVENAERLRRSKIYKDIDGEYVQPDKYSCAAVYRASRELSDGIK